MSAEKPIPGVLGDQPWAAPAHPVQAREAAIKAGMVALAEDYPMTLDQRLVRRDVETVLDAIGWDARVAHATAEVEALNEQLIELCEIVGAERTTLTEKVRANAHAAAEVEQLKADASEMRDIMGLLAERLSESHDALIVAHYPSLAGKAVNVLGRYDALIARLTERGAEGTG